MFSRSTIVLGSLIAAAFASPLISRDDVCHPNFEFDGVSIESGDVAWGVHSAVNGAELVAVGVKNSPMVVRFEQTGSPVPFYLGK